MAELKTKPQKKSVVAFLNAIESKRKRDDCRVIAKMMRDATGKRAKMWGDSIVGFGSYDYKYDSGRSGTFMLCGFSPRKQNLVIYIMPGFSNHSKLLAQLGKHKTGKSCLYINKLDDVDQKTLKTLIARSVSHMKKKYTVM